MFYLIVTTDEELVKQARLSGAGVFTANKSVETEIRMNAEATTDVKAFKLLRMLAIKPNLKGYGYIMWLLEKCAADPNYHKSGMTKGIYPECAEAFKTTSSKVERAIRHALETSYTSVPEKYDELFGCEMKKTPTNSEFLSMVSVYFANSIK